MHKDAPSSLQPISTTPAKIWRIVSMLLIGGGVLLMGWGGWLLLERQIEANKPPPAPIVSSLDRLPTDTPAPTPEPTALPTETPATSATPIRVTATRFQSQSLTPGPTNTPPPSATPTLKAVPSPLNLAAEDDTLSPFESALVETTSPLESASTATSVAATSEADISPPPVTTSAAAAAETAPMESLPDVTAPGSSVVDAPPAPVNRLVAESIGLDTPVVEVGWQTVTQNAAEVNVWSVAEFAAGWHKNSTLPGREGNIVFSGHHNIKGEVFRYIVDLEIGDSLTLYMGEQMFNYVIEDKFIVKDKGEPEEVRIANARWIGPFEDERVTMVTCWPYNNNTHRVIVIAKPIE